MVVVDESARPDPGQARTAAEFVAALRALKEWSGLTYRMLERRAAERGEALPRSTLMAALTRDSLPREELVAALGRSCGLDESEVRRWLTARRRLAVAAIGPADAGVDRPPVPAQPVPAQPVPAQPVPAQPVPADTAPAEAGQAEPIAATPGPAQPGAGQAVAAGPAEPGTAQAVAAGAAQPGAAQPGPVEPEPGGRPGVMQVLVPAAVRQASWPVRLLAGVLAAVVLAVVAGALVQTVRDLSRPSAGGAPQAQDDDPPGFDGEATPSASSSPSRPPANKKASAQPVKSGGDAPSTVEVAEDTTVVRGTPDLSYGNAGALGSCGPICAQSSVDGFERYTLLKFNVAAVPRGSCVTNAKLRLWIRSAAGGFRLHAVADGWGEATVTWNNRPARTADLGTAHGGTGWLTFTLPALSNGTHAFEIAGTDAMTGEFAAREDRTIARPAELVIAHRPCP